MVVGGEPETVRPEQGKGNPMSREAWQRIVDAGKGYDPQRMFSDYVCLHDVSKVIRGRSAVQQQDMQECPDCKTLKRMGEYEMEIESGPCDSPQSREMLNGYARGQLVAAYRDGVLTNRGGMSGNIEWQGQGATLLGRVFAMLNAGTHQEIGGCDKCAMPGHAEGWLRAGIIEGDCTGCRVNGAVVYTFEAGEEGAEFKAQFEGLLICQCNAD